MSTPRYLLDTNVLLRLLLGEPVAQAGAVRDLFARAAADAVILDLSPVIVAEAFYTLNSYYGIDRREAAEKLLALVQLRGVLVRDFNQVIGTLERLKNINVGFADAFLAAGAAGEKVPVASFDRDFDKFKDITRHDPLASKRSK